MLESILTGAASAVSILALVVIPWMKERENLAAWRATVDEKLASIERWLQNVSNNQANK